MENITAIKPVYIGGIKAYKCEIITNANPLLAHEGYLVFSDIYATIGRIMANKLIQSWKKEKKDAVLKTLVEMASK